jgi:hypothetical protein
VRASPILLVLALLAPASAAAGEDNPDVAACAGKAQGDTCTRLIPTKTADGPLEDKRVPGVCATQECCDLDYSKGSPPETICAACLTCQPGAGTPVAGGDGGAAAADGDGPATATPPADDGGNPPPAGETSSKGCRIGAPTPARGFRTTLWCLPLLGWARRRRRS